MRASDVRRMMVVTLAIAVLGLGGSPFALADNQDMAQMDTEPGPTDAIIDGQVIKIDGDVYTVLRSYSDNGGSSQARGFGGALTEKQFRVYVGKQTTKIKGEKKVGDKIRAEVTRGGFANSIQ
jgi:hypothetical protein